MKGTELARYWRYALMTALAGGIFALAGACGSSGGDDEPAATPPAGADQTAAADAAIYPVEVLNSDGSTLTVAAPPERIVSLSTRA